MQKGIAHSNGQKIYWESHGDGEPLILVMGIGYDSTLWGNQVPAFSQKYRTIIFDNRDAGKSSNATEPYTISDMADDLAGLMDELSIKSAHLLGISMGGMICQDFAVRYSDRVRSLVLTGTGAAPARAKFDPIMIWDFVKTHDSEGMTFAGQQFLWLFSEDFRRNHGAVNETLQMLACNPNPVSAEAFHRQSQAYINFDALDQLSKITAPTLVICGEQDRLTPPWICQEVADHIPSAIFTLVNGPGSSHVLPLEKPEEFNEIVLSFMTPEGERLSMHVGGVSEV
jgi:pimeloyl-ACP methyl ester carboxylesterase